MAIQSPCCGVVTKNLPNSWQFKVHIDDPKELIKFMAIQSPCCGVVIKNLPNSWQFKAHDVGWHQRTHQTHGNLEKLLYNKRDLEWSSNLCMQSHSS